MSIWIIMDTGPVRNVIQGDLRQVELQLLRRLRPDVRVSVAGPAFAELVEQLVDGRMPFDLWTANIGRFDGVVDAEFPFFPSGRQLTAFTGLEQFDENLAEEANLVKAWWRLLRGARSVADLEAGTELVVLRGQKVQVRLDVGRLRQTTAHERTDWIGYVQSFAGLGGIPSRQAVLNEVRRRHGRAPTDTPDQQQRLAPVFEMIATLVHSSMRPENGYNPMTVQRRGDTFDLNVLYVLAHPETVIVTTDTAFINRLRQTRIPQAIRVLSIEEFNDQLRAGSLESVLE